MRILFAISVVALMALLWASVSTAQYIRRARSRRKLLAEFEAERAFRRAEPPSGFAPVKIVAVPEPVVAAPPPPLVVEAAAAPPPVPFSETVASFEEEAVLEPKLIAVVEPQEARWPLARHRQSSAAVPIYVEAEAAPEVVVTAPPDPQPSSPFLKRPPVSVTPEPRPDWAYYNEDMGDLSDPNPRSSRIQRLKQRFRPS